MTDKKKSHKTVYFVVTIISIVMLFAFSFVQSATISNTAVINHEAPVYHVSSNQADWFVSR